MQLLFPNAHASLRLGEAWRARPACLIHWRKSLLSRALNATCPSNTKILLRRPCYIPRALTLIRF